jgi:biotin/methionine sulfoxide reductase
VAGFARFAGSGFGSGFDEFWAGNGIELPVASEPQVAFAEFRLDPETHPLTTPTGKIEIFSSTIDRYGYPDCPGHPVWLEPEEWLDSVAAGRFGLQLVANQPRSRLHSQLDVGASSQSVKIAGREPVRMHPSDAEVRGLRDGKPRADLQRPGCVPGRAFCGRRGASQGRPVVHWGLVRPGPADPGFASM